MQALRSSSRLARLVLAWFALTLGVALASPLVQAQSLQIVCGTGPVLQAVVVHDDGQPVHASHHGLDCPACLGTAPPPLQAGGVLPSALPMAHALHPFRVAHIAALVGAPLPARGPPGPA